MAYKILTWKKKFPKKRITKLFKQSKGRKPIKQEIDFVKENKYFNTAEW